jgi:flagellar hook protein FlgE
MGLLATFQTGISGLKAHSEGLTVVGDNIANVGTFGFKSSRAEFADILSTNLKGIAGGNQIGRGTKIRAVKMMPLQGSLLQTDNPTDLAVSGDGFFVLADDNEDGHVFTRDGSLHFDKEGYLVSSEGLKVQGFKADEQGDKITNMLGDLRLPNTTVPAKGTSKIELSLNIDSREEIIAEPFNIQNPQKTSNFQTGIRIFDSQGNKRLVTLFLHKSANNTWDWHMAADAADSSQPGGKPGDFVEMASGTLQFTSEGKLNSETTTVSAFNFNKGAFPNQKVEFDFGDAILTDKGGQGINGSTQYSSGTELYRQNQDGYSAGTLKSLSFEVDGLLTGMYSNGKDMLLGQVAIGKFENNEALNKLGNNLFRESIDSGPALLGLASKGGRGRIYPKTIEASTTDLSKEFVGMMREQKAFQASAKTITTADDLLTEVINLKR